MGGKRAKPTQVDRWRKDIDLVEKLRDADNKLIYSNELIAEQIDYDHTYLSSCKSGANNPGLTLIERFYEHFGHLIPPDELPNLNPALKIRDPEEEETNEKNASHMDNEYLQRELTKATDSLNMHISNTDKTLQIFQTMADTNKDMAATQKDLSKGILTLIEKLK